jgi:hypothetical protein
MKMRSVGSVSAVALLMTCVTLAASDKWESGTAYHGDEDRLTPNQLIHGVIQAHDLPLKVGPGIRPARTKAGHNAEPSSDRGSVPDLGFTPDLDFSRVAAKARHSYEVRVLSTNSCLAGGAVCATLDRVAENYAVLANGIMPDGPLPVGGAGWLAVRWTANADELDLIRVSGGPVGSPVQGPVDQYDIQMLDTTYLVPRWNNSGTQLTIFLIQNGSTSPIAGSIFFYNTAGTLLDTQPLSVAANATQVISTVGLPALAGGSGSAAIVHNGTYGALAGKAVALEPSTGFTFDTPITPIPY